MKQLIRRWARRVGKPGVYRRLTSDAGEGFIDVLVKMLIVVVIGAVLLAAMNATVPALFNDMMTKVRSVFLT